MPCGCKNGSSKSQIVYKYEWATDSGASVEFDTLDDARAHQASQAGQGVIRRLRIRQMA